MKNINEATLLETSLMPYVAPEAGVHPIEILEPVGEVEIMPFDGPDEWAHGKVIAGSGLWICKNDECDGVHHYYVKAS